MGSTAGEQRRTQGLSQLQKPVLEHAAQEQREENKKSLEATNFQSLTSKFTEGAIMTIEPPLYSDEPLDKLSERLEDLTRWLMENSPQQLKDARHLDDGTPERFYWHHGYRMALQDALQLLTKHNGATN